jgi:SET domain-containing protein
VIAIDDGRFVNHSNDPNSVGVPGNCNESMAARDIAPGDEITEDYRTYSMAGWGVPDQPFVLAK